MSMNWPGYGDCPGRSVGRGIGSSLRGDDYYPIQIRLFWPTPVRLVLDSNSLRHSWPLLRSFSL